MAVTQDWSALAQDAVSTRYFAGGDASDWCVHTPPSWARLVTIKNDGSGVLYVAMPALSGAAAATDHCESLAAGAAHTFVWGKDDEAPSPTTFSTWGADGAAHAMRVRFERVSG